ncbi:MAG TPA: thiol peroxidase [Actinomycetota bacterium]
MTVDVGTLAQTSEPLGVELAVAVGAADPPAGGRVEDAEGDVEEQAARPDSTTATATADSAALDGGRNRIDTIVADSSTRAPPVKAGRVAAVTEERTGDAFELGEQLTVVGSRLRPGDPAPDFALDHFDGNAITTVRLADTAGRVRLLSVVNSLDTPVCDVQTRRWASTAPEGVVVYTISMDLPFAQQRWMGDAGAEHAALSSHRSEDFGTDYGVLIKEWRMLQRALFVVDGKGTIVHAEYVADQMQEPDYDAAVAAAGSAPL